MSTQNNKYAHKLYLNLAKNDFVYSFLCGTSVIFLHWFTLEEDVIKKYTILWKNPQCEVFFGPYFPLFKQNMKICSINLRI